MSESSLSIDYTDRIPNYLGAFPSSHVTKLISLELGSSQTRSHIFLFFIKFYFLMKYS